MTILHLILTFVSVVAIAAYTCDPHRRHGRFGAVGCSDPHISTFRDAARRGLIRKSAIQQLQTNTHDSVPIVMSATRIAPG